MTLQCPHLLGQKRETQKVSRPGFFRVARDKGDFFTIKMCTEAAVPGSDSTQTHAYCSKWKIFPVIEWTE